MGEGLRELYNTTWTEALASKAANFGDMELSKKLFYKALISKQRSILEIGCGFGELCNEIYDLGYRNITGVDISKVAISYGKTKFPKLKLLVNDGESLKFSNNTFDACLSFDLLEHLPDTEKHLSEVKRVLKPSGTYIFQTPNIFSNFLIETILAKGLSWRKFHPSLQSSFSLKNKLIKAGFKKIKFVKIPPISKKKSESLPFFLNGLLKVIPWDIFPVFLQTNFYVIARL